MSRTKKLLIAVATGIGIGAGVAWQRSRPQPARPISTASTVDGDHDLAARTLALLPLRKIYALGVAEVTAKETTLATVGAPLNGTFEIGSINKALTGQLYVDALGRGEVRPTTRLGELLDLTGAADPAVAEITLQELAQHRSGLPRLPLNFRDRVRMITAILRAKSPYESAIDIADDLRRVTVGAKKSEYSNLGFAALGHAVAAAAGMDYPALVEQRLATPLGLGALYVPRGGAAGLDAAAIQGRDGDGRAQEAWTDLAYAPAGGVRADIASMATLARSLLDGSAPGIVAVEPVATMDGAEDLRIGAGWLTSTVKGRSITWHNGGTGGFSSWIGLDRDRGRAIILLGATNQVFELGDAGEALLLAGEDGA